MRLKGRALKWIANIAKQKSYCCEIDDDAGNARGREEAGLGKASVSVNKPKQGSATEKLATGCYHVIHYLHRDMVLLTLDLD
jgi:hypothetical protein